MNYNVIGESAFPIADFWFNKLLIFLFFISFNYQYGIALHLKFQMEIT